MLIIKISNFPSIWSYLLKLDYTPRGYIAFVKKKDTSTFNSIFIISKLMTRQKKI